MYVAEASRFAIAKCQLAYVVAQMLANGYQLAHDMVITYREACDPVAKTYTIPKAAFFKPRNRAGETLAKGFDRVLATPIGDNDMTLLKMFGGVGEKTVRKLARRFEFYKHLAEALDADQLPAITKDLVVLEPLLVNCSDRGDYAKLTEYWVEACEGAIDKRGDRVTPYWLECVLKDHAVWSPSQDRQQAEQKKQARIEKLRANRQAQLDQLVQEALAGQHASPPPPPPPEEPFVPPPPPPGPIPTFRYGDGGRIERVEVEVPAPPELDPIAAMEREVAELERALAEKKAALEALRRSSARSNEDGAGPSNRRRRRAEEEEEPTLRRSTRLRRST